MDGIIYLTLEQAEVIHRKTITYSGGGTYEPLDTGKLDSVLQHIQNDLYYPDFVDKLTCQLQKISVIKSLPEKLAKNYCIKL